MTTETRTIAYTVRADQALAVVVEARIRELLRFRSWYRRQPNWGHWMDLARDNDRELRALVRLARTARKLAQLSDERQPAGVGFHDWQAGGSVTEDDLFSGYGLDPEAASDALNREGDLAFNGAFDRW